MGLFLLRLDLVRRIIIMERKRTGGQVVWLAVVGLMLVGLVQPVEAYNGAVPVEEITADGDLRDWSAAPVVYPVTHVTESR